MNILNKLFKRKQEKWIDVWHRDQWLKAREDTFIKNAIIVKDFEGNYRGLRGKGVKK
ncbi:hypothetical protein SE116_09940 [Staphylococcus aureus]|uniref:hypothetical protein n=1 Tax=Staphylococcus aureus TaxID=1280 RepID=UPI0029C028EB|nr:hypothetical protein [Staphylococcus aureus]WPF98608.1 hypothetical protein SE116_09940 [Staphylococcus aureus]HDG5860518.1 hypothetical protein [Staphylococcus aureus]